MANTRQFKDSLCNNTSQQKFPPFEGKILNDYDLVFRGGLLTPNDTIYSYLGQCFGCYSSSTFSSYFYFCMSTSLFCVKLFIE